MEAPYTTKLAMKIGIWGSKSVPEICDRNGKDLFQFGRIYHHHLLFEGSIAECSLDTTAMYVSIAEHSMLTPRR